MVLTPPDVCLGIPAEGFSPHDHRRRNPSTETGGQLPIPHDLGNIDSLAGYGELFITEPAPDKGYNMRKKAKAAVDLGGTNLRAAAVLPDGTIGKMLTTQTFAHLGPDDVIHHMIHLLQLLQSEWDFESVGIASPGPLDARRGLILNPPNLPGWKAIPQRTCGVRHSNLPVYIENDAKRSCSRRSPVRCRQRKGKCFLYDGQYRNRWRIRL